MARLTPLGRRLARLPIDPRLARMILAGDEFGSLEEVLVIAAALAVGDVRERPPDAQQAATQAHARFADPSSDFLSNLNLWNYLRDQARELSSNQFRRLCRAEFLHYLRVREWQDVHSQLRRSARTLGLSGNTAPAGSVPVHTALLTGLLSHIGRYDPEKREYVGARGARFAVFPGSALFRKAPGSAATTATDEGGTSGAGGTADAGQGGQQRRPAQPRWVMAAELVETSRLWGRMAARIEPEWVEPLAGHLVRRSYSEPHWSRRSAAALAAEKVTLYGVPIVTARPVNYSAIDPPLCRELFIRHALVEGDWDTKHAFLAANQRLLADVEELEHRARRRDILVDDQTMVDFYDARIPPDVVSGRHFDAWWKRARASTPDLLTFDVALLVAAGAKGVDERDFPDTWQVGPDTAADLGSNPASGTATGTATGTASSATTAADRPHAHSLTMTYQFEPGSAADGVTVHVPLAILNQIPAEGFDWQVPGLREELVTALIRSLPKALRRSYVPAPNYARTVLDRVGPADGPILAVLERELNRIGGGTTVARSDWSLDRVPPHLRITFRVYEGTRTLGEGKDLDDLKRRLAPKLTAAVSAAGGGLERTGLTGWGDLGTVPRSVERRAGGLAVRGFPALVAQPTGVALRILATPADQAAAHPVGTRALVLASVASPARFVNGQLSNTSKLALRHHPHASVGALLDDCVAAAADALIDAAGGPVWDAAGFERLRDAVRAELPERSLAVVRAVERVLTLAHDVESRVDGLADRARANPALAASLADLRGQLAELVYPGFVTATGADRLDDLARYLTGAGRRLDRLPAEAAREQPGLAKVARVRSAYAELLTELLAPGCAPGPDLRRIRWMIEELRISLFAQTLRTPYAVSEERIYRAMDDVAA